MKKFNFIYIAFVAFLFAGCQKFLDLPPKNQRAVETLDDIKSALAGYLDGVKRIGSGITPIVGEAPIYTNQQVMLFEAYADNLDFVESREVYLGSNNFHGNELFYANLFLFNNFSTPESIWNNYYNTVGFLNALIDQLGTIDDGAADERNRVLGEMLIHRAFYLYKLQQYFAPYNQAEIGIPVYLHSGSEVVGIQMPRKSHAEVYSIVLEDLHHALELIQQSAPRPDFNIFYNARYISHLLAQVYWFKAESPAGNPMDYEQAKTHSQTAIAGIEGLIPATTAEINLTAQGLNPNYPAFFQTRSAFGGVAAIYGATLDYLGFNPTDIVAATDLLDLFAEGDIRTAAYFNDNKLSPTWPDGRASGGKNVRYYLFEPEEAFLILAEAQYRLGENTEAANTLHRFKQLRNAGDASGLSGDALLQEIINERRKEFFCKSDKRWVDLKRYANKSLSRSINFFGQAYSVTVVPHGYQYALPIPLSEIQQNPHIQPNEGWVQLVF